MSGDRAEVRALRRLAHGGAALIALDPHETQFGVFCDGDRRRRPLARVDAETVARWRAQGVVHADAGGARAFVLTADGRARLRRASAEGEAFANQHRLLEQRVVDVAAGKGTEAAVNLAESPLAWLARRGPDGRPFLTAREFAAGERLSHDHERAHWTPRVTMSWDATPSSGGRRGAAAPPIADHDAARAARRRLEAALAAAGPGLDQVLSAVCCERRGLAAIEKAFGWPQRSAKVMVKLALSRLADHYGIADPAPKRHAR